MVASTLQFLQWFDWLAVLALALSLLAAGVLWRSQGGGAAPALFMRWFPVGVLIFAGVVVLASLQAALFSIPPSDSDESALIAHWRFLQTLEDQIPDGVSGYLAYLHHPLWITDRRNFNVGLLRLDGEQTYVEVPSSPNLALASSFTLSAWIKVNSPQRRQALIHKADPQGDLRRAPVTFYVPWGEGKLGLVLSDGQKRVGFLSDKSIGGGRWQQVAVSFEQKTGQIRFFINGALAGERTTSWRPDPQRQTGPLLIGLAGSPSQAWHRFKGELLSIRIYNRALSSNEVQALKNPDTGLR